MNRNCERFILLKMEKTSKKIKINSIYNKYFGRKDKKSL